MKRKLLYFLLGGCMLFLFKSHQTVKASSTVYCTRGEFIHQMNVLLACPNVKENPNPFSDLDRKHPYYHSIVNIHRLGYVSGYANGQFKANDPIKKKDALYLIAKILSIKAQDLQQEASLAFGDSRATYALSVLLKEAGQDFLTQQDCQKIMTLIFGSARAPLANVKQYDSMYINQEVAVLKDLQILGDLFIGQACQNSELRIENCFVSGVIYIYGGQKIKINNLTAKEIRFCKKVNTSNPSFLIDIDSDFTATNLHAKKLTFNRTGRTTIESINHEFQLLLDRELSQDVKDLEYADMIWKNVYGNSFDIKEEKEKDKKEFSYKKELNKNNFFKFNNCKMDQFIVERENLYFSGGKVKHLDIRAKTYHVHLLDFDHIKAPNPQTKLIVHDELKDKQITLEFRSTIKGYAPIEEFEIINGKESLPISQVRITGEKILLYLSEFPKQSEEIVVRYKNKHSLLAEENEKIIPSFQYTLSEKFNWIDPFNFQWEFNQTLGQAISTSVTDAHHYTVSIHTNEKNIKKNERYDITFTLTADDNYLFQSFQPEFISNRFQAHEMEIRFQSEKKIVFVLRYFTGEKYTLSYEPHDRIKAFILTTSLQEKQFFEKQKVEVKISWEGYLNQAATLRFLHPNETFNFSRTYEAGLVSDEIILHLEMPDHNIHFENFQMEILPFKQDNPQPFFPPQHINDWEVPNKFEREKQENTGGEQNSDFDDFMKKAEGLL